MLQDITYNMLEFADVKNPTGDWPQRSYREKA